MTREQQTALEYHCRLATETLHPRFRWVDLVGACSTVLTVNSGYE
jgi:hypothetical protein